jgi:PAS domain S-box-containing protein
MDISRRREIEKELATYRQRLEEVIADRTAECAKANRRLREEIEERHKNEEGMILRAAILDNAKEAIFLVNSSGDFVYANEVASKTYGYTHDEILNMNLRHLLPNQDANQVESRIEETIANGRLDLQTVHVKKDGTMIKVEVRHSLIKTKHGQFIVSVTRDIS